MDNIIYLDDYINLFSKKNNKLIISKPYKNTLRNGFIIDRDKFIKKFHQILSKNEIGNNIFAENISIIINNLYSNEDKLLIKTLMEELNYKNINFIQEINYLKVDKNTLYINYNYSYFYLLYTNYLGNIEINLYKNDDINKKLIIEIINLLNKKEIIIYGKNIKELERSLKKNKIDYYFYEDYENLIIQILINNKKV